MMKRVLAIVLSLPFIIAACVIVPIVLYALSLIHI